MSKMPAKKKSCFQITSVTQAQVAGSGQPDDTESLDDPDESRTEDISSSEIFDNVSRAELEPGGERSSSEEALNNVGESEPQNKPHSNGGQQGFVARDAHGSGQQGTQGPSQASQTSQLPQSSSSGVGSVSCSSRFRLIKLDHGTGEPFRRGRWTCTEYYEKDPDGGRTVDSIRHTSVSLSEQGTDKDRDRDRDRDRDSGLGATGGSVVAESSGLDPVVFHHFDLHGYGNLPQQQVPPGSGTPDLGGKNVIIPHGLLPPGNNGLHQGVIQKSPGVAPAQAQSLIYPAPQQTPQQLPLGHHLVEYGHLSLNVSQTHPGASLPVVHPVSQGPSPVPTPAVMAVPGEMAGLPAGVAVTLPGSQPGATIPNLMAQIGTGMIPPGSSVQLGQFSPASLGNAQTLPASTGAPASMPATGGVPVPSASLSQAPVARNGVAGPMVAMSGFVQPEEGRRKSDAQAQAPLTSTKDLGKPLISEDLPLASSGVNTLFGIAIPIDGDDDSI
ncbi:TSC22 domain family protein 2 isoform X2 [Hoplias malabaricus]|uniref:TSC22 domain family protein 2 isoform X2 n=1 Tax=Hoplias malabaricus TaxID=27720 RepID=UPI0034628E19